MAADMARVDEVIRARLSSDVALIEQISHYIIGAGGKRIRPRLVLLFAQALGHEGPHSYELAATVEFIHTATLLHDDVVDESSLRRGRQTANAMFGNAASVLVGDFLYSRAFQMMVSVNRMRVLDVLADATNLGLTRMAEACAVANYRQRVGRAVDVRVVAGVERRDRVDHLLRLLGRGGVVEPSQRLAVDSLAEDRKVVANRADVEGPGSGPGDVEELRAGAGRGRGRRR